MEPGRRQVSGRGLIHAIVAPLCHGGALHRVSARATLLRPAQLLALAARDARARSALARMLERDGTCDADSDECGYALLARPAELCPACPVPRGGASVLLSAHSDPAGGDVELAAWGAAEGLEEARVARVDWRSACWGRAECAVAVAVEDAQGGEVARYASVVLLAPPPDSDGPPLWPPPSGPA